MSEKRARQAREGAPLVGWPLDLLFCAPFEPRMAALRWRAYLRRGRR